LTEIDIALKVLDHQILDRDGRRCGNVDDVEIEGGAGEQARVTAILVGPGFWPQRAGWIGRVASWIGGSDRVRVLWEDVADVEAGVILRKTAQELGLGRGDDRLRPWIEKIPGANR
jgi:sporulation protein YlmC with PRC-barrel domain